MLHICTRKFSVGGSLLKPTKATRSSSNWPLERKVIWQHITSMVWQWYYVIVNIASIVSSLPWLDSDIATRPTWTRRHYNQHDSDIMSRSMLTRQRLCQRRHHQHWLGSTVTSMIQGLDAYFPDSQSDSEIHRQSCSRVRGVPLQPTAWLEYTFTYIADLESRRARRHHNVMGYFVEPVKSYS
jgi:hypothetical protein